VIFFTVTGYLTCVAMCFCIGYELAHVLDMAAGLFRVFARARAADRALHSVIAAMEHAKR
jgi:hypothetical protein